MSSEGSPPRFEPIPDYFANALAGVTSAQLDELANSTTQMLASGRTAADVVAMFVQVGWDPAFSQWYVGVFAGGGRVDSSPPRPSQPTVDYPRTPMVEQGNWWDKQAAPYKEGSGYLWFHAICCACPGVVIALLLMMFCGTETGKANGRRLLIYSSIGLVISFVLRVGITLFTAASK